MAGKVVYIIGFMGSGKSTAGKKLASLLGWNFIDLDKSIETSAGKSIADIFASEGEESFRKTEAHFLRNLPGSGNTVISTGGGTPCHGDNMNYMLQTGVAVYLKLTPEQLRSRLSVADGTRPLLKNLTPAELLSFIENKLDERTPFYEKATIICDGFNLDINNLITSIKSIS